MKFEEIARRAGEMPESTKDLVDLNNYITESKTVILYELKKQLLKSAEYIDFLMDYAEIPGSREGCVIGGSLATSQRSVITLWWEAFKIIESTEGSNHKSDLRCFVCGVAKFVTFRFRKEWTRKWWIEIWIFLF